MMSRLSAGLGAAILGLAASAAHAQGCMGPAPCPGGYRPASTAYVFQPGPTPAYQAAPVYAPQPYAPQPYVPGPGDLASYPGYPPAPGYAPEPAPNGYPGLPPAPYAQQPYNYVPAYGRGVYADRPYNGPAPGYNARGCGGGCAPPVPAFQPCASPCGYPAPQAYAQPAPAEVEAPAVAMTDTFFYGLSGGSGGFPEGGGGGGGINPQGFGFDNGFGISAANNFFNGYSSANAFANASAASNVNVNVNNQAYANANAWAAANANAYAKNVNMPYAPKPMPMHPWGMGMVGSPMAPKHGCNCARHAGGHR